MTTRREFVAGAAALAVLPAIAPIPQAYRPEDAASLELRREVERIEAVLAHRADVYKKAFGVDEAPPTIGGAHRFKLWKLQQALIMGGYQPPIIA